MLFGHWGRKRRKREEEEELKERGRRAYVVWALGEKEKNKGFDFQR